VAVESSFPLTAALSLGEKEQPRPGAMFSAHWLGRLRRGYGRKTV